MRLATLKQGAKLNGIFSFQADRTNVKRGDDAAAVLSAGEAKNAEVWGPGFELEWSTKASTIT